MTKLTLNLGTITTEDLLNYVSVATALGIDIELSGRNSFAVMSDPTTTYTGSK